MTPSVKTIGYYRRQRANTLSEDRVLTHQLLVELHRRVGQLEEEVRELRLSCPWTAAYFPTAEDARPHPCEQ